MLPSMTAATARALSPDTPADRARSECQRSVALRQTAYLRTLRNLEDRLTLAHSLYEVKRKAIMMRIRAQDAHAKVHIL